MEYKNLTLIGTSHIAKESVKLINEEYDRFSPDIIAIELDRQRLIALIQKSKNKNADRRISIFDMFKVGFKGFIFALIGEWVERKLGESVGVFPGIDMLSAYNLAIKNKKNVALIDQEIGLTLKRFSKELTWKEKWNFLVDVFNGLVLKKTDIEMFDLTKVPKKEIISKLISRVKQRYPNVYKVLIKERNEFMAKQLSIIMKQQPQKRILAVIGAGHEEEIVAIIKKKLRNFDVVYSSSYSIDA